MGLIIKALKGNPQPFFRDEGEVHYIRAIQGFHMDFNLKIHRGFRQIIEEQFPAYLAQKKGYEEVLRRKFHELKDLLFKGFGIIATSFLTMRVKLVK
jgi:hypothetical protein